MDLCPVCQQPASDHPSACPSCGHPLLAAPAPSVAPAGTNTPAAPEQDWVGVPAYRAPLRDAAGRLQYSNVQPVWQYLLLQLCSFGIYTLIWFYEGWKLIKERRGWHITPAARAIFAIFWIRSFAHEIALLAEETGYKPRYSADVIAPIFIGLSLITRPVSRAEEPLSTILTLIIFVGEILLLLPIVHAMNAFWRHTQPDLPERPGLTPAGWMVAVLGGLIWCLAIISLFLPAS